MTLPGFCSTRSQEAVGVAAEHLLLLIVRQDSDRFDPADGIVGGHVERIVAPEHHVIPADAPAEYLEG